MAGASGGPVVATLVCYLHFAHEAAGAAGTRHSPRPLLGENFMHDSGASRRRKADSHPKLVRRYCEAKRQSNPDFYFAAQTMDCFFDLISSMFYQKSHLRGLP